MSAEQAQRAAELMEFFLHDDHEADENIPGPYEQGANSPDRRVTYDYLD